jgi:anti-sigma factor RsiW
MNVNCGSPISSQQLVEYWAGELDAAAVDQIDEHVMGCDVCAAASARVAALREAVREFIPTMLSRGQVEALRARGLRIVENPVRPETRELAVFGAQTDLLIHRLGGLDLSRVQTAQVTVSVEPTGEVLTVEPNAPFEREAGEILICCQRHFSIYPSNVVFDVRLVEVGGAERNARYVVPHLFE